jgi:GAF domain-containing protein
LALPESEYDRSIRAAMTELTRYLAVDTPLDEALASVTAAAVELIEGVDYADVMLIEEDQFRSVASTAPLVTELDAVQLRLREGPCLQAATDEEVICCPDLTRDPRWPGFAAAAVDAGVRSTLSFQLYTHRGGAGALNLLGCAVNLFRREDLVIGAMLATHAANALLAANREHQFKSALASRDLIGQAKGMIMERFDVTAVRAFELMKKLSQDTNTPLRVIAHQIDDKR